MTLYTEYIFHKVGKESVEFLVWPINTWDTLFTPFKIGPNGKTKMDKESNLMVCTSTTSTLHQSQNNYFFPSKLLLLTTRWRVTWSKMHQIIKLTP